VIATREDILERIIGVLGGVSGVMEASRNRSEFTQDKLPAIILLDGSEEIAMDEPVPRLKTVRMVPAIMRLRPEIFVILPQRADATNTVMPDGTYNPIGPALSFWRDAVLAALINDATLVALLTSSGQIVYRGCATDMATGRTMWGQLQLFIDFHYVWFPPTA